MSPRVPWRSHSTMFLCVLMLLTILTFSTIHASDVPLPEELPLSAAQLVASYPDPETPAGEDSALTTETLVGHYAVASPVGREYGRLVHVLTADGQNHGCQAAVNAPPPEHGRWIALVRRGDCKFRDKILNAVVSNASAVIVYNNVDDGSIVLMNHYIDHVVSVFVAKPEGDHLAALVDSGVPVQLNISLEGITVYNMRDTVTGEAKEPYQVQPLLIISVSLISFLITGLTILLVFGIRRTKAQHKKARRHIVFTLKEGQQHRLLLPDIHVTEPQMEEAACDEPHRQMYSSPSPQYEP